MKKLSLFYCFFITINTLFAQADSLKANQLFEEAGLLLQQSEIQQAIDKSREAATLYEKIHGSASMEVAKAKKIAGIGFAMSRQMSDALPFFSAVLDIHKNLLPEDDIEIANDLNNLGIVYRELEERNKALENFEKAIEIYKLAGKEGEKKIIAPYSNMANVYKSDYDFYRSVLFRMEALRITENVLGKEILKYSEIEKDIAGDYFHQLNFPQALVWYQKALPGFQRHLPPSHVNFIDLRSDLANCHCELKNFEEAEHYIASNQKIILAHYGAKDIRFARNKMIAAGCLMKKEQQEDAIKNYKAAIEILETNYAEINSTLVNAYLLLGIAYFELAQYDDALASFKKGLERTGVEQNKQDQNFFYMPCKLFLEMGETYAHKYFLAGKNEDFEAAAKYFRQSILMTKHMIRNYTSESSKVFMKDHTFAVFDLAIQLNWQRYKISKSPEFLENVYHLMEETNHVLLYNDLEEDERLAANGFSPEQIAEKKSLEDSIAFLELEQYKIQETGKDENEIKEKLFIYNKKLTDCLNALPETYFSESRQGTPTIPEVQEHLSPDESLVSYFYGDSLLMAFVINKNQYELFALDTTNTRQLISAFQNSIQHYDPFNNTSQFGEKAYRDAAIALHEKLIAPLEPLLQKKLVIIPSGQLAFIAFDALLENAPPAPGKFNTYPYLMKKHEIRYAYAAKMFARNFPRQQSPEVQLAAFAPTFSSTKLVSTFLDRATSFTPLQFTKQEAENIAALTGGKALVETEASKHNFLQIAPAAKILHLATHAKANTDEISFASIAFGNKPDDQLFAKEIYTLDLPAELVVLSACETAVGTEVKGEGMFSLGRAFTGAGVQSLVSSLWKIDDRQSSKLMQAFYQQLVAGNSKSTALHLAKQQYIENARNAFAHPAYWAAFTLYGENDAVTFSSGDWYFCKFVIVLLFFVTSLGAFYKMK